MVSPADSQELLDPATIELRPGNEVLSFGPTLVVAPHPDDESLGCGGAIRLLRDAALPVTVVLVTDGTGSHRASHSHPPVVLGHLRAAEATRALATLGVAPERMHFMHLADGSVPDSEDGAFEPAVVRLVGLVQAARPATVLVPWRRDPHEDHRAAWQITTAAIARCRHGHVRIIEYPIWLFDHGASEQWPRMGEVRAWRLDIGAALPAKRAAIACHCSQTTDLISDDPQGFRLSQDMLDHFTQPWELYLEACR